MKLARLFYAFLATSVIALLLVNTTIIAVTPQQQPAARAVRQRIISSKEVIENHTAVDEVIEVEETIIEEPIIEEEIPVTPVIEQPVETLKPPATPVETKPEAPKTAPVVAQPEPVKSEPVKSEPIKAPTIPPKPEEPAPKPVEAKPATKANQVIFAGGSTTYSYVGKYNPSGVLSVIDSGIISASVTNFNPNDGQTTYFAGHNPGVMSRFNGNLQIGSLVTISDNSGSTTQYKMIDVVKTDTKGQAVFGSLGISAAQLYYMGSGSESIAIQYCVNGDTDMRVWYGIKV